MAFLRVFGKSLISIGFGVLLFVVWALWGTGFYTAKQQNRLEREFASQPDFVQPAVHHKGGGSSPYRRPPIGWVDSLKPGDAVFRIRIPKINLNEGKGFMVVEGVGEEELKAGPGHYPACDPDRGFVPPLCTSFPEAWPGEKGRVVVSGHRTTFLAPFWAINELNKGDKIFIDTHWGDFTYVVTDQRAVLPTDTSIVREDNDDAELVLTTCNPRFSASQRLVTFATMETD
ncbi:MAG: sortase [Actinomycetota bacterium]|nr:sortase [Actinomycetota bacterium]